MSDIPVRFTGDDWNIPVALKLLQNGVKTPIDVSGASAIEAAVVSSDDDSVTAVIAAAAQSAGSPGADWANGVIACVFPAASTGISTYGRLYLEIQVTEGGLKTTYQRVPITVKKGVIA